MATSTYPTQTGTVDNTSAATFIPEIWSDEIVASYKANLVAANLIKRMSMRGKKATLYISLHLLVVVLTQKPKTKR